MTSWCVQHVLSHVPRPRGVASALLRAAGTCTGRGRSAAPRGAPLPVSCVSMACPRPPPGGRTGPCRPPVCTAVPCRAARWSGVHGREIQWGGVRRGRASLRRAAEEGKTAPCLGWGGALQAEGTAAAKALRQQCASCVQRTWGAWGLLGAGGPEMGAVEPRVWKDPQASGENGAPGVQGARVGGREVVWRENRETGEGAAAGLGRWPDCLLLKGGAWGGWGSRMPLGLADQLESGGQPPTPPGGVSGPAGAEGQSPGGWAACLGKSLIRSSIS